MLEKFVETVEKLCPRTIESYGSALIDRIDQDKKKPNMDLIVLNRGKVGEEPTAWVPKGEFDLGDRVEIIKRTVMSFTEPLLQDQIDSYYIRPWNLQQVGKNLEQLGFRLHNTDCLEDD